MKPTDTMADRDLQALPTAIAGQVLLPGEAGYDQARQAWNLGRLLRLPSAPQLPGALRGRAFINFEVACLRCPP